jgi:hypothetical protein
LPSASTSLRAESRFLETTEAAHHASAFVVSLIYPADDPFCSFQSIVLTFLSQSGAAMQWIAIADCIGRWAHDFAKRKKRARSR